MLLQRMPFLKEFLLQRLNLVVGSMNRLISQDACYSRCEVLLRSVQQASKDGNTSLAPVIDLAAVQTHPAAGFGRSASLEKLLT